MISLHARVQQMLMWFTKAPSHPPACLRTQCVLYTLFPAIALGAGLSVARSRYMRRPLATLREAHQDPAVYKDLKAVYRFKDTAQVTYSALLCFLCGCPQTCTV